MNHEIKFKYDALLEWCASSLFWHICLGALSSWRHNLINYSTVHTPMMKLLMAWLDISAF